MTFTDTFTNKDDYKETLSVVVTPREAIILDWLRKYPFSRIEVVTQNGVPTGLVVRKSIMLNPGSPLPEEPKMTIESKMNGKIHVYTERQVIIDDGMTTKNVEIESITFG